jgi:hypothetical protein
MRAERNRGSWVNPDEFFLQDQSRGSSRRPPKRIPGSVYLVCGNDLITASRVDPWLNGALVFSPIVPFPIRSR